MWFQWSGCPSGGKIFEVVVNMMTSSHGNIFRSALLALCEGNQPVTGGFPSQRPVFYLICAGTNDWANNRDTGELRRHRVHSDVTVMRPVPHSQVSYEMTLVRILEKLAILLRKQSAPTRYWTPRRCFLWRDNYKSRKPRLKRKQKMNPVHWECLFEPCYILR